MVTRTDVKSARRDGVKLAYADVGTGEPPLLFVHGWCCNGTHWRDQIPEFSRGYRVIAIDQRGHGESDKPDQDYTISGFVDDLAWLIGELRLERPVIVGHSMGGVIALNVIRKQPDLARAVVFVDAPIIPPPEAMDQVATDLLEGLRSPAYRDIVSAFSGSYFFRSDEHGELTAEIVKTIGEAPQRLMHTAMSSLLSPENMPAGPLPVPSLFVRAKTAYATEEQLKERYPGMEVVTLDTAHFVQMEKPEEFNRIVRGFLEGLE